VRRHPRLLEVNARLWLARLSERRGRRFGLDAIPDHVVKEATAGFDLLWLMGAWKRSGGSRAKALAEPSLRARFDQVLPGWSDRDVEGSPYAVRSYTVDTALGPPWSLSDLAAQLGSMGTRLIVDFVPNHLALDHPWTAGHPDWFVGGGDEDLQRAPDVFFRTQEGAVLAHGRDPYFPPWSDTVQVDFFSPRARAALTDELFAIAQSADGVRCDMAMLPLNDVFRQTWGAALGGREAPAGEFWTETIARIKERHPNFIFIAEAYWGRERQLLELGFDYAYDKTFYDRLLWNSAHELRQHLANLGPLADRGLRFTENHDERRAMDALGPGRVRAAAIACLTLPGIRLIHDGQMEGNRMHLPVQLVRAPAETPDESLAVFYRRLLEVVGRPAFQRGTFSLREVWPGGDDTHDSVVAWSWSTEGLPFLVAINQSGVSARARIAVPEIPDTIARVRFLDALDNSFFDAERGEAAGQGFMLELPPWGGRVLEVTAAV
jgi:glycosidase